MGKLIEKYHDFQYDSISGAKICTKCGVAMSDESLSRECYGRGNPFGPPTQPQHKQSGKETDK